MILRRVVAVRFSMALGIGNLEKHDRVDVHGDVVAGDDRLGREIGDLFFQRDFFDNPRDEREFEVETGVPHGAERAQLFHNVGFRLLNDVDIAHNQQQENEQRAQDGESAEIV